MKIGKFALIYCLAFFFASVCFGAPEQTPAKKKILVVDSYHRNYTWSTLTSAGLCDALLSYGYFDDKDQIESFMQNDRAESSKIIMQRTWLNSKRETDKLALTKRSLEILKLTDEFRPDLIFLGDDSAAEFVGIQLLNSPIPVVFWGLNQTPTKYGLLDSAERPGHNITGVYQTGYLAQSLNLLTRIAPGLKTFAVLSDASSTGRANTKALEYLARQGSLPLELTETVVTNEYELWQSKALALQEKVDAFFLAIYSTLKDKNGHHISTAEAAKWYSTNIIIPETTINRHFVQQGMLCSVDDSGYKQGYLAAEMAHAILAKGVSPATFPPRTPERGSLVANRQRAQNLGITLTNNMGIEEIIEEAAAAKKRIMVVSSYHDGFPWSMDTNKGFCDAMLQLGYFDSAEQINDYTTQHFAETETVVIQKLWMDSKRKSGETEIEKKSLEIYNTIEAFQPDLVFLGDDNAARYIGGKLLDLNLPVVFWGVNQTPTKYGLVDTVEKPGHNVTGVYQSGYHRESLEFLSKLLPDLKTFAVLSNATTTGRSHHKQIEFLARKGELPLQLTGTVATNDWELWKQQALELQEKVNAFYVAHYQGLKDADGNIVPNDTVADWYMNHIRIPEATVGMNIKDGFFCGAFDPGYNQGHLAVEIAHDILAFGANPATYPPKTPFRGPLTVNKKRAGQLGITLTEKMGIEDYVE